jgi:hypothetical protein
MSDLRRAVPLEYITPIISNYMKFKSKGALVKEQLHEFIVHLITKGIIQEDLVQREFIHNDILRKEPCFYIKVCTFHLNQSFVFLPCMIARSKRSIAIK